MSSYLTMILYALILSFLAAEALAFAPVAVRPPSLKCSRQLTVVHSALTYKDWHASLQHPLDDLGVEDDYFSSSYNTLAWTTVKAPAELLTTDGGMVAAEIAKAFLPVAMLVMLEITYSLSTQTS